MKGRLGVVVLLGLTLAVTPVGASSDRTTGSRAAAITAGIGHTCALTRLGGVKCWGYNGHDELGTGDYALPFSSTPVDVFGLSGVTAISAGVRHTCALTSAGGVKCWGANYSGALGDGTTERHGLPVDVAGLSSGVTAISAGYDYGCALTAGGGVKCWGSNAQGMLGDGTTEDRWTPTDVSGLGSGVTAIAAGIFTTCAVTSSGRVKCWGLHYGPTPAEVPGLIGAVAITAAVPICALTTTGGVKCWGGGNYGWTPVDIPGLGSGVTAIAANAGHACALRTGGGVECWGENDHGQLGDGTKTARPTPVGVSGLSAGVTAIGAGAFHTCAVTRAGGAKCWGINSAGVLGDGTTRSRLTPVGVVGFGPRARLAIVSQSVAVTSSAIAPVRVRCAQVRCQGTLTLGKLGSRRFSIAAGHTRTVKIKLTARGFRELVRKGKLSARARARYSQPAGGPSVATRTITLEAPARR